MATMTISEAEHILDIVSVALQDQSHWLYHPISSLKGFDVFQIDMALKLRIANEFLFFSEQNDCDKQFEEGLNSYCSIPLHIVTLFVEDDKLAELDKLSKTQPSDSLEFRKHQFAIAPSPLDSSTMTFKDERLAALETPSSFGKYCQSIGSEDPLYWHKVYTRIGLDYTSGSPKGNEPVFIDGN